jgi:hypothetical protein
MKYSPLAMNKSRVSVTVRESDANKEILQKSKRGAHVCPLPKQGL